MLTYTYISKGKFALMEKPKPVLRNNLCSEVKQEMRSRSESES